MKFYLRIIKIFFINCIQIYFKRKKINYTSKKDKIFVMLSANYNNLGDIAITLSQKQYLEDKYGSHYEIIEIPVEDTYKCYLDMKKNITDNSIITLIGGGNDGSLYDFIEEPRLFILKKFNDYKIISFPQSVMFENTQSGNYYLKKYRLLASKCDNYTIVAREKKSYDRYLSYNINSKLLLVPDIVFYFDRGNSNDRDGICIIMRDDKEKSINANFQASILRYLKENEFKYDIKDTCSISINNNREEVLNSYCQNLSTKKLVITDRLHGMILSYVTNTPCIVFNNNNDKIKSTYETWLTKQNLIYLVETESLEEIKKIINKINDNKKNDRMDLKDCYRDLEQAIQGDGKNE